MSCDHKNLTAHIMKPTRLSHRSDGSLARNRGDMPHGSLIIVLCNVFNIFVASIKWDFIVVDERRSIF